MFGLNASTFITNVTEKVLQRKDCTWNPDGSVTEPGVLFHLEMRVSTDYIPDNEERGNAFANVWMILSGNTSVFFCTDWDGDKKLRGIVDLKFEDFENTSNHDSCWRTDGVNSPLDDLYFKMCDRINAWRKIQVYKELAPIEMQANASFGIGTYSPWVDVMITKHSVDPIDSYRQGLVKVELVKD